MVLLKLFLARLDKKYSSKTIERPDVILKTLFRLVRKFYTVLLGNLTMFNQRKRKGNTKEGFIGRVDHLVGVLFGSIF